MTQADVTVIIPFYKGREWLLEALKSVKNQTQKPKEIIIVDDGSSEGVPDSVKNDFNAVIIRQCNSGAAHARNEAIRKSTGKYLAFLDTDDIWHPQKIELQIKAMDESNAIWSFTSYSMFHDGDDYSDFAQYLSSEYRQEKILPGILCSCQIATPTVMVRRDALLKQGFFFNEKLKCGEDTCLWYLLANKSNPIVFYNSLAKIRLHGDNAANDIGKQLIARKDLWRYFQTIKVEKEKAPTRDIVRAYGLCIFNCNIACRLFGEKRIRSSKLISIIFYAVPWITFKGLSKIHRSFEP